MKQTLQNQVAVTQLVLPESFVPSYYLFEVFAFLILCRFAKAMTNRGSSGTSKTIALLKKPGMQRGRFRNMARIPALATESGSFHNPDLSSKAHIGPKGIIQVAYRWFRGSDNIH